jgi:hypothetical protein
VLVPVAYLEILEGLVLGQHPEAGTHDPDVLLLVQQQRQLALLGDEGRATHAHDVSAAVGDLFGGGLDGDLQSEVLLPHVQEGGLAVLADGGDAAAEGFDRGRGGGSLGVLVEELVDGDGGTDGPVDCVAAAIPKLGKDSRRLW